MRSSGCKSKLRSRHEDATAAARVCCFSQDRQHTETLVLIYRFPSTGFLQHLSSFPQCASHAWCTERTSLIHTGNTVESGVNFRVYNGEVSCWFWLLRVKNVGSAADGVRGSSLVRMAGEPNKAQNPALPRHWLPPNPPRAGSRPISVGIFSQHARRRS